MPRLIILLLPVVALIVLVVQNRTPAIALNFLGGTLLTLPFGLLLAIAVALGALITLVLYGLVGLRRQPESKYKPMGRRVPYPDGSDYSPTASRPYSDPVASYTSSSFVDDPSVVADPGPSDPTPVPSSYPRDSPPSDNPQNSPPQPYPQDLPPQDIPRDDYSATYEPQASPQPTVPPQPIPSSSFIDSLKSSLPFTSKSNRGDDRSSDRPADHRSVGDNWGELRTTEQINDWETAKPSVVEEGVGNLFRLGKSAGTNVGRIADDIASGWNKQNQTDRSPAPQSEQYPSEQSYSEDELDRGWENFDDGYDAPSAGSSYSDNTYSSNVQSGRAYSGSAQPGSKRTYGDSLYGEEAITAEDGYDNYPMPEQAVDEIGPDGVYEADYRVIVPPSKPLDETLPSEDEDDRYYS